jgi:tetratricopeptide (TPR) repeat protein
MKRRIGTFILGLVATVVLLEVALRIVGMIHFREVTARKGEVRKGDYTILCMGDSFTFGIGASEGGDYPRQLERLLNSKIRNRRFVVVNRGVGGYNTSQILNNFPAWVDEIKPDLIVVMAGGANAWNYWGYRSYKRGDSVLSSMHDQLYRIRIFKLIKLLQKRFPDAIRLLKARIKTSPGSADYNAGLGNIYTELNQYEKAIKWFKAGIQVDPKDVDNYRGLGYVFRELGDYNQSIEWFKVGIEVCPGDPELYAKVGMTYLRVNESEKAIHWFKKGIAVDASHSSNYYGIGCVYSWLRKHEEAIKWFKEGIQVNPEDSNNYTGIGYVYRDSGRPEKAMRWFKQGIRVNPDDISNYHGLAEAYNDTGEIPGDKTIELMAEAAKRNPVAKEYIKMFENKRRIGLEARKWMESDLEKITGICREKQIPIILQNYPQRWEFLSPSSEFAEKHGALFVDNRKAFNEMWERGERREDYFVPDGHCNDLGYSLMAKNIYDVIVKANIFDLDAAD